MWPFIILGAAAAAVTAIFCDDDSDADGASESHRHEQPLDAFRYRPRNLPSPYEERTQEVNGYVRWDGTAVRGYKRRPSR